LNLAQALKRDDGQRFEPACLRAKQAPMACDDRVLLINKDRVGEPELADRGGDLFDLALGMSARIARVRLHIRGRNIPHGKRAL